MSALPELPAVRDQYTRIIDGILAASDLNTISIKRIRNGIQDAVEYDITPHKDAIKDLIMKRFDYFTARQNEAAQAKTEQNGASDSPSTAPTTNGHTDASPSPSKSPAKRQGESEESSDTVDNAPPKKKRKADNVDADALMAARLQAEENMRARPTRGGASRKATTIKKKAPKKKTASKVKNDDDSELEDSDGAEKPVRNTGFHKPLTLSPALSALLGGETALSRPQTVKRLWAHIKANDLQDPADKRQIICDEPMRAVFKQDKVHMFTMTKILNQNLYTPDE